MNKQRVNVFWFRRDLRLEDNHGLYEALKGTFPVLPIFIFDTNIIDQLEEDDSRLTFIHDQLKSLSIKLNRQTGQLLCYKGTPENIWMTLLKDYEINEAFANEDYEPYAIQRDNSIKQILAGSDIKFNLFKDQVIYEKGEILKSDLTPYTVFTPYKNKWLSEFSIDNLPHYPSEKSINLFQTEFTLPRLSEIGFQRSSIEVPDYTLDDLDKYAEVRNLPALNKTSHLSTHLRFGTVSIRQIVRKTHQNQTFLSELIWREFFMQILYHFPDVVQANFKRKYDRIKWRNDKDEFEKWKKGLTGFPMVDAGMRELNQTGLMHNRVRMVVAGFLCKHLLIDWRWGEAYFAQKLLDYELSSNNGNWQWSAGTGCDAAPYFRVFNPTEQVKKIRP